MLALEEGFDLLSAVRLGMETGLVPPVDRAALNELLLLIQPAHLQSLEGRTLPAEEQAVRRAELIKRRLRLNKPVAQPRLKSEKISGKRKTAARR